MRQVHVNCTVDGCGLPHKARGLCNAHYAQLKRGVNPNQPIKRREMSPPPECTVSGCGHPVKSKGLCHMHYARNLRHGFVKNPDRTKPFQQCWYEGCDSRAICQGLCNLHYTHSKTMVREYGITMHDYLDMWRAQHGVCFICGQPEKAIDNRSGKPRLLAVDHNHATGEVRSLLCRSCNTGLGMFEDDPVLLDRAADYLRGKAAPFDFDKS